jgi:hypothetical protein
VAGTSFERTLAQKVNGLKLWVCCWASRKASLDQDGEQMEAGPMVDAVRRFAKEQSAAVLLVWSGRQKKFKIYLTAITGFR